MLADITYLENSDIYLEVMERAVMNARRSVWIATANVKYMGLRGKTRRLSIVRLFQQLAQRKVEVRLLYAATPSAPFMKRFSASRLEESRYFTMRRCPRVHMKTVIVDHRTAYMGSANLTGAGMGYRDERFRNFETGILTTDGKMIDQLESFFDFIWRGEMCQDCGRRNICPKPIKDA